MSLRDEIAEAIEKHSRCWPLTGTADPSCGMPEPPLAEGEAGWVSAHLADVTIAVLAERG